MNMLALVVCVLLASVLLVVVSRTARSYVASGLIGFGVWLLPEPASSIVHAILEEGLDYVQASLKGGRRG